MENKRLIEGSGHLNYEIDMFDKAYRILEDIHEGRKEVEDAQRWAFMESFFIHVRNLYEFFKKYGDANKMGANQYVYNSVYPKKMSGLLQSWVGDHINNRVTHIRFRRIDIEKIYYEWPITEIYKEMRQQLIEFLSLVPEENICDELKKKKKAVEKRIIEGKTQIGQVGTYLGESTTTVTMGTQAPMNPMSITHDHLKNV